jgi:hypothetical protein
MLDLVKKRTCEAQREAVETEMDELKMQLNVIALKKAHDFLKRGEFWSNQAHILEKSSHRSGMRGAWEQFFKKAKKQGKFGACDQTA